MEPLWFAIYDNGNRLNIGHPAAIGAPFRVAHIMTERR
jgi:hypothetical protein